MTGVLPRERRGRFIFKNFLAVPHGMWDVSSPIRDRTHNPCTGTMESSSSGKPLRGRFRLTHAEPRADADRYWT